MMAEVQAGWAGWAATVAAVARADAQAVKVAMVARAEGKEGTVEQAETAVETAAVVAWAVVGVTVVETAAKVERAAKAADESATRSPPPKTKCSNTHRRACNRLARADRHRGSGTQTPHMRRLLHTERDTVGTSSTAASEPGCR